MSSTEASSRAEAGLDEHPELGRAGAVTVSAVSNQDVSVLSNAASSGTGGAVSISGGASTTSTTGVGGALTSCLVAPVARRPVAPVVP